MNEADALDLIQAAIWTIIVGSGPAVAAAMAVGIVVALIQALTQVQEMTLTFVPKIVVIFAVISLTAPFIGGQVYAFTETVYGRIEKGF
jgi:flagellar biosynthetic protein FliQ